MQDAYLVFALIGVIAIAMATNKVRYDFLALTVVLVLSLSGLVTVSEAFSGFGHPVVVLVACLLVVGEMLDKTGVAQNIGESIARIGGNSYVKLLSLLMVSAALLSCVMSSTAVVAIFIPIALGIAQRANLPQSSLLMPVAYAALTSGMITLIATPPNLVVNDFLIDFDGEGLGFFAFAPMGFVVLSMTTAFFCLVGKNLFNQSVSADSTVTSSRSFSQLWKDFNLNESVNVLRVDDHSDLIGKTLAQTQIDTQYKVRVLAVVVEDKGKTTVHSVVPDLIIDKNNILVVTSTDDDDKRFTREMMLSSETSSQRSTMAWLKKIGAAVVLIHPQSSMSGQSIIECRFRSQQAAQVMGIQRHGVLLEDTKYTKLRAGDMLFIVATWKSLRQLAAKSKDFVFLENASELDQYRPNEEKGKTACIIVATMILLKLFNIVPITIAAMLAVIAAVLTRCLTVKQVYASISWSSLVLIAGMLPLATALEVSGGTQMIVDGLIAYLQSAPPALVIAILFSITTLFTLVLSNTTSAVLMTPIAIGVASSLGLSPYPLAVAGLMGASTAFASPVSTSVVTIIVEPGQYRFIDFIKAGLPLTILTGIITVFITPLLFPF